MFQISIETLVAIVVIIGAVFSFSMYFGSKQDKKSCQAHNEDLQRLQLDLVTLRSQVKTIEATNQLQMQNIQVQLEHIQRSIDILGRIDALEGKFTR